LVAAVASASMLAGACGGDDSGTGGSAPEMCSDFSGVTGSPSFKDDVMPIFALSCALSPSCHEEPTGTEDLVLGQRLSAGLADQMLVDTVHAAIVGGVANRSDLPIVDPGNPANSWLLLKMAYSQDELTTCSTACSDCGEPMPPPEGGLDPDRVETVAAWIASGAPNN
jgi:hypothetical protein